jgi:hypothetical protein
MKTQHRQHSKALRFIAGWCALLLYLGASSPVGLGMAALFGSLDRDHRVAVQAGTAGTRVVLHHERRCVAHHHGVMARALTLFAAPSSTAEADHVLQFSAADSFSRQSQLLAPSPAGFEQPVLAATEVAVWCRHEIFRSPVPTYPSPGGGGRLRCLRSTLLLI